MKKLCLPGALLSIIFSCSLMHAKITFQTNKFSECSEREITQLAQMRVTYFKGYPYFYDGTQEYEENYLGEYKKNAIDSYLVQAFHEKNGEKQLVGILTGCGFCSDIEIVRDGARLFTEKNISTQDRYYLGEAIIIPEYQHKKILPRMLYKLGQEVVKLQKYMNLCFLTVIREDNDPRKPEGYQSTDKLWEKLGCYKTDVTCSFEWPTIMPDKSVQDIFNKVEFWTYEPALREFGHLIKFVTELTTKKLLEKIHPI